MSTKDIDTLDPAFHTLVDAVRLDAYAATGFEWVVVPKTGATRTIKEQHGLYIRSRDGVDNDGDGLIDEPDEKVTGADGGTSPHNFGMGCDCVPKLLGGRLWWKAPKSVWAIYGSIVESHGLVWGGHFKSLYDAPHMESKDWRKVRDLWRAGKIQVA